MTAVFLANSELAALKIRKRRARGVGLDLLECGSLFTQAVSHRRNCGVCACACFDDNAGLNLWIRVCSKKIYLRHGNQKTTAVDLGSVMRKVPVTGDSGLGNEGSLPFRGGVPKKLGMGEPL